MTITSKFYGRTTKGEDVYEYLLTSDSGMCAHIIELGCAVTQLWVPDKDGVPRDVVLGYDTLECYEAGTVGHGALIGRHANRIENARFTLDGKTYTLTENDGPNHLHGTFAHTVFRGKIVDDHLILELRSRKGEDGFPGNLDVSISYTLTEEESLVMDYVAVTDAPTLVNLTNHSYFNLDGRGSESVLHQTLQIKASAYCEGNAFTCPTGRILPVAGTPFDFTKPKAIGTDIAADDPQVKMAGGYDHNFVLDKEDGQLARAATAASPVSGICMDTYTTQPGMQLYTANFIQNDTNAGKDGVQYQQYNAFCLETQHFPCAPSHPEFPSVVLRPDEEYHHTTVYQFKIAE